MTGSDTWHLRGRTLEAAAWLVAARLAVALLPLPRWSGRAGLAGDPDGHAEAAARRLAAHVRRAAGRLPFEAKCLPQAFALSRMLRRRAIPHRLVIAARPEAARGGADDLHAWIAVGDAVVLGDLPGPWLALYTLP